MTEGIDRRIAALRDGQDEDVPLDVDFQRKIAKRHRHLGLIVVIPIEMRIRIHVSPSQVKRAIPVYTIGLGWAIV